MVIENSASQTQGWDASLDQICYCDRCATVEKRVRKRGATLCKTPLIHKGLAAKEVGHVGWRSPTPKLLHRSFLKLRLDQNNWETLLPMSAACGQHLGCKTCMISIQLQRIWKEYTDVILLGVCGDWAFAIMLFPVLFFFFFFFWKMLALMCFLWKLPASLWEDYLPLALAWCGDFLHSSVILELWLIFASHRQELHIFHL